MRVLFQMSANDSGHLLDAPWASKLGPRRALFASEEQGRLERFRPYSAPTRAGSPGSNRDSKLADSLCKERKTLLEETALQRLGTRAPHSRQASAPR